MTKNVLILTTSYGSNELTVVAQRKLIGAFTAKRVVFNELDGAQAENKERRNELFGLSGIRGQYPQVFIIDNDTNHTEFVGDAEKIDSLLDCDDLPSEYASADIPTFTKTFTDCERNDPIARAVRSPVEVNAQAVIEPTNNQASSSTKL